MAEAGKGVRTVTGWGVWSGGWRSAERGAGIDLTVAMGETEEV